MGFDIGGELSNVIIRKLNLAIVKAVDELKLIITNEYDSLLVGVVTDRNSKTNPSLFRDDFVNRVDSFNYIDRSGKSLSIISPDMDNFDFSGRLKVIETIMSGVAGVYVEMSEEDYVSAFNKKPVNEETFYEYVPIKDRIYLVRYTSSVRRAEKDLRKKFIRYPFSNSPPIDVFRAGSKFVEDNIDNWIKDSIEKSKNEYVISNKGATI
jgi:hypothetical protein